MRNVLLKRILICCVIQLLKDIWKIACSYSGRSTILLPAGNEYLVGPIDFAGPCQSKITFSVHIRQNHRPRCLSQIQCVVFLLEIKCVSIFVCFVDCGDNYCSG